MTRSCRWPAAVAGALTERRSWAGLAQLLIGLAVGICLLASAFVAAAGASPDRSWSRGLAAVTTSVGTPIYAYDRIAGSRADVRDGQLSTAAANAAARSVRSVQPDVGPLTSIGSRIATNSAADRVVIGKLDDIRPELLGPGERSLLDQLPDLPPGPERWAQNERVLLQEIKTGNPIRDATIDELGNPANNSGFLYWERATLLREGWGYDSSTHLWSPGG